MLLFRLGYTVHAWNTLSSLPYNMEHVDTVDTSISNELIHVSVFFFFNNGDVARKSW